MREAKPIWCADEEKKKSISSQQMLNLFFPAIFLGAVLMVCAYL